MRTTIITLVGIALWSVGLSLAKRFGKPGGPAVADTTLAFITCWLLAALTNLWIGVTQAGYSLREGVPVFLVIFAIPAAIAAIVQRTFF